MGSFFSKPKRLVIIRGLPGSGKTTLAHEISGNSGKIFSSDDYFIENGYYIFQQGKCRDANLWNQKRVEEAIKSEEQLIIVDNVNARKWEAKAYVELAVKHGFEIQFVEPNTSWKFDVDILAEKSVHSVSKKHIVRMLKVWETDFTVESVLNSKEPWLN